MDTKPVGLPPEKYDKLSQDARYLYTTIYDYCTYSDDPQYKTLHKFRKSIDKLKGTDREYMIEYFNNDPAIQWNGMPSKPFDYYADPY